MGAYVGPDIAIEEGLVLNIDAANPKSYIGSGTLAYNMASPINSGSLIDNTVFSNDKAGAFNFDGVDDYIQVDPPIPQATTEVTINVWFKATGVPSGFNDVAGGCLFTGNPGFDIGPVITYSWLNETVNFGVYTNQAIGYTPLGSAPRNTILNVCGTFTQPTGKIFINGEKILTGTKNFPATYQNNTSGNRIGGWGYLQYKRTFNGQIYLIQVYNRELSEAEVLQNYNALKPRFIN